MSLDAYNKLKMQLAHARPLESHSSPGRELTALAAAAYLQADAGG